MPLSGKIALVLLVLTLPGSAVQAQVQRVLTGFVYTEGPVLDGAGNLYFTDYKDGPGKIYKWDKSRLSVFVANSGHANGLAIKPNGEIVACQASGSVVAFSADGRSCRVLADAHGGRRLNAPNDLTIDCQGGIYFTDPCFEAGLFPPQGVTAVYYLAPDGSLTRLIANLRNPNGIELSPDQKTLFVIASCRREVMAYAVVAPGRLSPGRVFTRLIRQHYLLFPRGDGAAVDAAGNLYVATARSVQVFDPAGRLLRLLRVPERPSNAAVSPDGQTLFITAGHSVYQAWLGDPSSLDWSEGPSPLRHPQPSSRPFRGSGLQQWLDLCSTPCP